jgi:beta-glucosidase
MPGMADPGTIVERAAPSPWWGTVASATGAEGAAPAGTWARWEEEGRVPPSGEGNGFATNYHRDWAMLAEHDLPVHRLGVEWARIEPRPGKIDGDAVEHALAVVGAATAAGIDVWVTLHDTALPGWFADDEGGFVDDHARTYFWTRHVDRMGELLGDLVAGWVPIEDPVGYARRGWLTGTRPPGRTDPEQFPDALRAVLRADLDAWRLLRSGGRPVATSYAVTPAFPAVRSREPDEREAAASRAAARDALGFATWVDALREGMLRVPGRATEEISDFAGAFDLVGISYDHAWSVFADGSLAPYPADARPGPLGWAPWPEGLGGVLRRVHDELPGRELLLTGFGLATAADDPRQDEWRVEILRASRTEIERAVADGVPLRGAFHRNAVDGYEWEAGFSVHRGVFDRDRRPKPSVAELTPSAPT